MILTIFRTGTPNSLEINQFLLWLITAFAGALIVKFFDWLFETIKFNKTKKVERLLIIEKYLDQFSELYGYYRLFFRFRSYNEEDDNGEFIKIDDKRYKQIKEVLVPDKKYTDTIKMFEGKELDQIITHKVFDIQVESSRILDYCSLIDKSGQLEHYFADLYGICIFQFDQLIINKENVTIDYLINMIPKYIQENDDLRRKIYKRLNQLR